MSALAQVQVENTPQEGDVSRTSLGVPCTPLDKIREPGAYVCSGTGDLVRVVRTGACSDEEGLVKQHGTQAILVTQVSKDPFIPITGARIAAANLDIEISF